MLSYSVLCVPKVQTLVLPDCSDVSRKRGIKALGRASSSGEESRQTSGSSLDVDHISSRGVPLFCRASPQRTPSFFLLLFSLRSRPNSPLERPRCHQRHDVAATGPPPSRSVRAPFCPGPHAAAARIFGYQHATAGRSDSSGSLVTILWGK